ncbi:MAG TPA: TIGR02710 family CRISPR-associated protein [Candidatus Syntrophoarchaeum butanivorans]|uniref:CRISPR-associated protein n=1 Tax=Candidatus Syntropharchaeum butanivorans TaxID=1839936 RepID=A0A1F2P3Y2_9EURY|nr:MAG: CRISPR-associated protein [Candidatus Syntrophoarchaeum butanivorans]HEC56489.1 TIGR02710 family CRISPR-associated protein [Candidatus Syntrophoarchaeum butanivorans]
MDEIEARERFVERFRREFLGRYRFLILPVGTTPEPLIRTILCVEPEKVGFIYTRETADALDRIVEETGLRASQVEKVEVSGSEPGEVYEKISGWVERYDGVAVDITGGKKAMVGGATVAASFYGLDILYNDYEKYDPDTRKPIPGTEVLRILENPFEATQVMIHRLGVEAFNRGDYTEARRLFDEGGRKTRGFPRKRFEVLREMAGVFLSWETFNFGPAYGTLKRVVNEIEEWGLDLGIDTRDLGEKLRILERLSGVKPDNYYPDVLQDPDAVKHLLLTCFTSAERKSRAGRYEDGVLRLYRVCEMAAQHRLALRGVNTEKVHQSGLDQVIIRRYREIKADILSKKHRRHYNPEDIRLPDRIGLMDDYILLKAFDDDLVKDMELRPLFDTIEVRNLAYIEHGMRVVREKDYGRMRRETERILQGFSGINGLELEKELERYRFPVIE